MRGIFIVLVLLHTSFLSFSFAKVADRDLCHVSLLGSDFYSNIEDKEGLSAAIFFVLQKGSKNAPEVSFYHSKPFLAQFPISINFLTFKFEAFSSKENDSYAYFKFAENNVVFLNQILFTKPRTIYVFARHSDDRYSVVRFDVDQKFLQEIQNIKSACV